MTTEGGDVLKAVHQVREFYGEVANLLLTIDGMMKEQQWPAVSNACLYDTSYSIQQASYWMPCYVFRFYTSTKKPSVLLSACVEVECLDQIPIPVVQPLLIGEVFDFEDIKVEPSLWRGSFANWHLWIPNRTDDGKLHSLDPREERPNEKCKAKRMTSFARPLLEFTDAATLKEKLVNPLLKIVGS